jgi:hypothetical protein
MTLRRSETAATDRTMQSVVGEPNDQGELVENTKKSFG